MSGALLNNELLKNKLLKLVIRKKNGIHDKYSHCVLALSKAPKSGIRTRANNKIIK